MKCHWDCLPCYYHALEGQYTTCSHSVSRHFLTWFWKGYDLPNTNYYASCNTWVHKTDAPFPTLTRLAAAWTESPAGNTGLLITLQLLMAGTGRDNSLLSDVLISLTVVFPMANYILYALLMFSIWQLRTWVGKMKRLSKNRSSPHKITQVAPSRPLIPFALSYCSHLHLIACLEGGKRKRKNMKSLCKQFTWDTFPRFTGKKSYRNEGYFFLMEAKAETICLHLCFC